MKNYRFIDLDALFKRYKRWSIILILVIATVISFVQYQIMRNSEIIEVKEMLVNKANVLELLLSQAFGHQQAIAQTMDQTMLALSEPISYDVLLGLVDVNEDDRFSLSQTVINQGFNRQAALYGTHFYTLQTPQKRNELYGLIQTFPFQDLLYRSYANTRPVFYFSKEAYLTVYPYQTEEQVLAYFNASSLDQVLEGSIKEKMLQHLKANQESWHLLSLNQQDKVTWLVKPFSQYDQLVGFFATPLLHTTLGQIVGETPHGTLYLYQHDQLIYPNHKNSDLSHVLEQNLHDDLVLRIDINAFELLAHHWWQLIFVYVILLVFVYVAWLNRSMVTNRFVKPSIAVMEYIGALNEGLPAERPNVYKEWQEALERTEDVFSLRNISKSLPGVILRITHQKDHYSIQYVTRVAAGPLKEADVSISKRSFLDYFDENSRWNLENMLRDSERYMLPIEYEAKLLNDPQTCIQVLLKPILTHKNTLAWEGILLDVTDRKLLERELAEEKQFVEELFETSGVIFCVIDATYALIRYNKTFKNIMTLRDEDLIDQAIWDNQLSKESLQHFKMKVSQALTSRYPIEMDLDLLTGEGLYKTIHWSMAPIASDLTDEVFIVMTGNDVTAKRLMEDELKTINMSLTYKNKEIEKIAYNQKQLFSIFDKLRQLTHPEDIFNMFEREIKKIMVFRNMFLAIKPTRSSQSYEIYDAVSDFDQEKTHLYFKEFKGLLGQTMLRQEPYVSGDIKSDPDYVQHHPTVNSMMLVPIIYNGFLWGVFGMDNEQYDAYTPLDLDIVKLCASHLSLYLEELEAKNDITTEAMKLRSLHEVVKEIINERDEKVIAKRIVGAGLLEHLALYWVSEDGFDLLGESHQTSRDLYGVDHSLAVIDHAKDVKTLTIKSIGNQGIYHFAKPVISDHEVIGVLYSVKEGTFSIQEKDLIAILTEQLSVLYKLNKLIEKREKEAMVDPLTGIWNRRFIMRKIDEEDMRIARYGGESTVVIMDLGEFKYINDTFGHTIGDEVLFEVAQLLQKIIRETDYMGRYGGDEFIFVMPNTNKTKAEKLIARMKEELKNYPISEHALVIQTDFGLASVPHEAKSLSDAFKVADVSMYRNKKSRKGHFIQFDLGDE